MRVLLLALLAAAPPAAAQTSSRTYVYDFEGRRAPWTGSTAGDRRATTTGRDLNGREGKIEEVEEKVVKNEGGVKVVERLIRRYDPNGRPLPPEKEVVETTERPGGVVTTATTVYRADLNGRLQAAERVVADSRKQGEVTNTETRVERLSINGSFQTVERRVAQVREGEKRSEADEVSYLPDPNGKFVEAYRRRAQQFVENGAVREQVDEYESATSGKLQLSKQTVARIEKDAAGGERRVVDIYGVAAPGRPVEPGALALRERQIISVQPAPGGAVQTLYIQRPDLEGRGRLGEPVKISETVCTGQCIPAPKAEPPKPAAAKPAPAKQP